MPSTPSRTLWSSRSGTVPTGATVMRGTADMLVALSRMRLAPQRPRRRGRAPAPRRRPGRAGRPAAEPVPLAGGDGSAARGRGRPVDRAASSSTRPSGSTSATTHRTCTRSTPPAPASSPRPVTSPRHRLGPPARGRGRRRPVATCASTSTSPSPGCCSPSTAPPAPRRPLHDATALLDRLLAAAEDGGRVGTVIEIEVLRAVAHQRGGRPAGRAARARRTPSSSPNPRAGSAVLVDADPGPGRPRSSALAERASVRACDGT